VNTSVVEEAVAALESLDADRLVACYEDGFTYEDSSSGETITTRDELHTYFDRLFSAPGTGFVVTAAFRCGDRGSAEWTWSGRRRSGEPFAVRGSSVFEFGDEGITHEVIYYDPKPVVG
jgi:hypothetical protein